MERPKTLSATFVKTVNRPGRYGDGRGSRGLSLLVKPTSTGRLSKSWAQRLRLNRKPYDIGLGSYPTTTLATAREKALNNARMVAEGHDPRTRVAVVPRFVDALEIVIGLHRDNWKDGGKTESLWRRSLVLQRRVDVPLRESFVAQGLLRQLLDAHLRREWASGERPIPNASL